MTTSRNIDLKWIETQTNAYKKKFSSYKDYADILKVIFKAIADKHEIEAIVQSRPKEVASFSEKIVRKSSKYQDPVNQFTDLCGARIITQTQSQVNEICEVIEASFQIDWENSVGVIDRLKPSEFGYRSVHYIIQFKTDFLLEKAYNFKIPDGVYGLKAEIQVRTLLEHAWADLTHKWVYKNEFEIPTKLEREMAGIAARLEAADNAFSGVQEELKNYYTTYGAYLDPEQLAMEIEKLEVTLKYDPENLSLIKKLGRAALALEDWDKVTNVIEPFISSGDPDLMRMMGTALCKQYKGSPSKPDFLKGQELLLIAGSAPHNDSDALSTLAGSWKGIDDEKSDIYYQKAFEIDPTDAYCLGNYLESEILKDKNLSIIGFTKPVVEEAIERSRSCIQVDVNIPWAYYDLGKLNLFLKDPFTSFSAYAKAINLSTAPFMVETSLDSILRLESIKDKIPGYQWVKDLFYLGLASNYANERAKEELQKRAKSETEKITRSCVILVGGSRETVQEKMESYTSLLKEAFKGFHGTIISGGTKTGISKLAGDLKEAYPENIITIGYLPAKKNEYRDNDSKRYAGHRTTDGETFSPLEATQYWMDIIAAGIEPENVKILAVNGGEISLAECILGLMLGADVGIIGGSGGEPVKLFSDTAWNKINSLIQLPNDAAIINSFISSVDSKMDDSFREILAKEIHERYMKSRLEKLETADPSLEPWETLDPSLKHSNLSQADQIFEKLDLFGYAVRNATGDNVSLLKFPKEVIEEMAKLEHARWVVERLSEGWKPAPKKDVSKKLSPYLVGWEFLSEDIRKYDRDTVENIPAYLAKVGLEVYQPE